MNKIPCDVVRDLFPSYIDQLTSEASNSLIREHIKDCTECSEILDSMRAEEPSPVMQEGAEKIEIDFLKKNRRRNKWIIFICAALVVVILAVVFVTRYMIGEYHSDLGGDFYLWDVDVEDRHVSLTGRTVNDIFKFTGMEFTMTDGVLKGRIKAVPSGFIARLIYGNEFHYEYTASEPVRQVEVNDRVLWKEKNDISTMASRIYMNRHDYIGDMPGNDRLADALGIREYLGPYSNELQTGSEPYGWVLYLAQEIPQNRREIREADMDSFASVLLANVNNLDRVSYVYEVDGKKEEKTVTAEDASAFFGQDIKNCYDDVNLLEELLRKTGLERYLTGSFHNNPIWDSNGGMTSNLPDILTNVVNQTDEKLKGIIMGIYIDGELAESQGGEHADGSLIDRGDLMGFSIDPVPLNGKLNQNSLLEVDFTLETSDGQSIQVPGRLRIPVCSGVLRDIHITGNSEEGFSVHP